MKRILLASHGKLASGIKSSIKILTGKEDQIETIDAYLDDADFTVEVEKFLKGLKENQQYYIFTDIYGGSVNQKVVSKVVEKSFKNVQIITGMNLPIVLAVLLETEKISKERLKKLILASQVKLVTVNSNDNSEENFFE